MAHGQHNAREAIARREVVLAEDRVACAATTPLMPGRTWRTRGGTGRETHVPASGRRASGGRHVKEPKAASASTMRKGVTTKEDGGIGDGAWMHISTC